MAWESVNEKFGVWRAEYYAGVSGLATSCAIANGDTFILISPPGGDKADALLDALAKMGDVTAIVAPCRAHRMGIPSAQKRFPNALVYCDSRIAGHVSKVAGSVHPLEALQATMPKHIEIFAAQHMKQPDTIARIHTDEGAIWYLNDLVTNIQKMPSKFVARNFTKLLGFKSGIHFNRFFTRIMGSDRPALRKWLLDELTEWPPIAVVFGHGPVATGDKLTTLYEDLRQ